VVRDSSYDKKTRNGERQIAQPGETKAEKRDLLLTANHKNIRWEHEFTRVEDKLEGKTILAIRADAGDVTYPALLAFFMIIFEPNGGSGDCVRRGKRPCLETKEAATNAGRAGENVRSRFSPMPSNRDLRSTMVRLRADGQGPRRETEISATLMPRAKPSFFCWNERKKNEAAGLPVMSAFFAIELRKTWRL
jgi:hypothetical protein